MLLINLADALLILECGLMIITELSSISLSEAQHDVHVNRKEKRMTPPDENHE
jgi:hypothetical protein